MSTAKESMSRIIDQQPDDSSYDEILRELAFARMVDRGLADSDQGCTIENSELGARAENPILAEINWTVEAERWMRDIHDYIAADSPTAAQRTIEGIFHKSQLLARFPHLGY